MKRKAKVPHYSFIDVDGVLNDVSLPYVAAKVAEYCDAGLCNGLGDRSGKKGSMCVEAVVSYLTTGNPNSDTPACVDEELRGFKIKLNDATIWMNNKARGRGLRRIAIAQLGTKSKEYDFSSSHFFAQLRDAAARRLAPHIKDCDSLAKAEERASHCTSVGVLQNVVDFICGYPCSDKRKQKVFMQLIEDCVQILIKMKTPGSKYLKYAPLPKELVK
jgi:hypothetical protein